MIDYDELAKLFEAKEVICRLCDTEDCEACQVSRITNEAFNSLTEQENVI